MADVIIGEIVVPEETIGLLRQMIGSTDMTDAQLAMILVENMGEDGTFNLNYSAASVWTFKASSYAELVNVSESGSSRNLGDLHKNALLMAARYRSDGDPAPLPDANLRRSRTRAIVRPGA